MDERKGRESGIREIEREKIKKRELMRENERELTKKNGWEKFDERWIERK